MWQQAQCLPETCESRDHPRPDCMSMTDACWLRPQEATKHMPGHAEYLACLSKQWSDITFIPGTPDVEAKICAEKGIALAEQVRLDMLTSISVNFGSATHA